MSLLEMRDAISEHLQKTCCPNSLLLRLWEVSYIHKNVLVLPAEAATQLAETDPQGYHAGVWRLATEYEELMARALLTNSDPHAPGYQQPKSFSAWPRRHDVNLYRTAAAFRKTLQQNACNTSTANRMRYLEMVRRWHHSIRYISRISGDTRLDVSQLKKLYHCVGQSTGPDRA